MTEFTALPAELSAAVDRLARKRTPKKDPTSLLLARHEVLRELGQLLKPAEREGVDQLREAGVSWAEIAEHDGRAEQAVWTDYSSSGTTTPESRRERVRNARPRIRPANMPGKSVAEAADEIGTTSPTIHSAIRKDPEAAWHVQVKTEGKLASITRILDTAELRKVLNAPGKRGPKTAQG